MLHTRVIWFLYENMAYVNKSDPLLFENDTYALWYRYIHYPAISLVLGREISKNVEYCKG